MVAWFIIAIATLAVFGFITVNAVQTLSMTSDAAGRVETVRRLDAAANALLARAASPDANGVMYLPAGAPNGSAQGYGLPQDMGDMARTPFGKPIVYCPFGDEGGTGTALTITNANGNSYEVKTRDFDGKSYVISGRPAYAQVSAQKNLIGFVMAAPSKLAPVPSCNMITYDAATKKFQAKDAVVRALSREGGVDGARTVSSRRLTFYVEAGRDGIGTSGDPASLATAVNYYRSQLPSHMTIVMQPGNYALDPAVLNIPFQTSNFQSNLTIVSETPGGATVDMLGQGALRIPGHLVISGVLFDNETQIYVNSDAKFSMFNSQVGYIIAEGAVRLEGTNALTYAAENAAIRIINGGRVQASGNLNFYTPGRHGIFVGNGGKFSAREAQIIFSTASTSTYNWGILVRAGGEATLDNAVVHFPTSAVYGLYNDGGYIQLVSSSIQFGGARATGAVAALEGSRLSVVETHLGLGVYPQYGIWERGSIQVESRGSSVYANAQCWRGEQFAESLVGNGVQSKVQDDVVLPTLSASPTNVEVQNYVAAQSTNARRQALRLTNRTTMNCVM